MPYRKLDTLNDYQKQMRNGNDFVFNNICRISNNNAKEMFKLFVPN